MENSCSSVQAAIDHNLGFEVDLQQASCGTIMVFHDDRLERLTHGTGLLASKSKTELQAITFRQTDDKMMSLQDLLDLVASRVPILLEVKSSWQDKTKTHRLVAKIVQTLKGYGGPFAVMSFDPAIIRAFVEIAPMITRGLISERFDDLAYWHSLTLVQRTSLRFLASSPRTRPDFIAYDIEALPALAPLVARYLFQKPLLTWTVRTREHRKRAQKYCDAMIFEGFVPDSGGKI